MIISRSPLWGPLGSASAVIDLRFSAFSIGTSGALLFIPQKRFNKVEEEGEAV